MKIHDAIFGTLQQLGKALMLPVAVLPAAGIFLGVGAADFAILPDLVSSSMEGAGGAIFGNIAILFAIGVALGLTKNDGVSALAATVCYFVMLATLGIFAELQGYETKDIMGIKSVDTGVFGGILSGVIAAILFNKYYRIQLPTYLGFFAGKRFVPIASAFVAILVGAALSVVWPPIGNGIKAFSHWAAESNPTLAFAIYGFVERLLIPFGLHHIWNLPFFWEVGSYVVPETSEVITGELYRYTAGDPSAGNLAGGYLFKMWGLPAAAIAIWHSAKPENRVKVGGIMMSAALTSFLTGITEPIEFAFMFVAPVLYLIHAVMSSAAFVVCIEWGIKHGTTFSHGLIDFGVLFGQSKNAGWMLVIGPLWGLLYYGVFRFAIAKFNLKTPGREDDVSNAANTSGNTSMSSQLVAAFGGFNNIHTLDACITRLRVGVNDVAMISQDALKSLGASGVIMVGNNAQAIFGPASENLKTDMEAYMETPEAKHASAPIVNSTTTPDGQMKKPAKPPLDANAIDKIRSIITNLGGNNNIKRVNAFAETRLRLELIDAAVINEEALTGSGVKGVMKLAGDTIHLIVGDNADQFADEMDTQLS